MGVSVKMEAASSNFTLLIELFTEENFDGLALRRAFQPFLTDDNI